jgi:predicted metalloendopeptidase
MIRTIRKAALFLLSIPLGALALHLSANTVHAQHLDRSELSTTCKPCEDFYKYANEGWLATHPIPDDHSDWGHWDEIIDRNRDILHKILDKSVADVKSGVAKKGSNEQKIGDYYASAMDTVALERDGITPLDGERNRIKSVTTIPQLIEEVAHLHSISVGVLFSFGSEIDPKKSDRVIAACSQGGLGLPDREYYFRQDSGSKALRDAYVRHIANYFVLTGKSIDGATHDAQKILAFETVLAGGSMTLAEQRDPDSVYHDMKLAEVQALTPHFSWHEYFAAIGAPNISEVDIGQPKFLSTLDSLLARTPISDIKAYFEAHLLQSTASQLNTRLDAESFAWVKQLYGVEAQEARWKRVVRATDWALGEALGQEYVKVAFPPDSKVRMRKLIDNLKEALRADLSKLDWISNATRAKAIEKLNDFTVKIGYPDKWRDYSNLEIDRGPYVLNAFRAREFEFHRDLAKIGKPVDRTEWGMTPPTVNAYYNPSMNEIVFPAGILQPPFFDAASDDAYNYGAIGAIIGHEMTHGFDDEGAKFDGKGNLKNWWAPEDLARFEDKSKCIVQQFNGYTIEDSIHLKGDQVVGESIADLGGVTLAYNAYMKSLEGKPHTIIDGFTPEQRFFIGWARAWAANMRPEAARMQVNTDFHPLNYFRVIGPLSNFPPFAAAFNCANSDKMVRAATERCVIW